MKVVHLLTSLDYGGVEKRMEILSRYHSGEYEIEFCAIGDGGATLEAIRRNNGVAVSLGLDHKIVRLQTLKRLVSYFKKSNPDIIHAHGAEANFYGILAGKLAGVPKIFTEEIGIPSLSLKAKLVFSCIHHLADAVIAMSPTVRRYMLENKLSPVDRTCLVYNPVFLSSRKKINSRSSGDAIKFVFVGRLEEVKNPLGLLSAFKEYKKEGRKGSLTFVGDGSQRKSLEEQVKLLELSEYVSIYGFRRDVLSMLLEYDVVVQPSITEGFSIALVEAMSCGLPAISTPAGSAPDLIINGENGWLVSSSDVSSIYSGLCNAWEEKDRLQVMGERAFSSVSERHNPEAYSEKLHRFYMEY